LRQQLVLLLLDQNRTLRCLQRACDAATARKGHGHVCVADEHFVATLLTAYGLAATCDGIGLLTFTDWSHEAQWHPRTFYPGGVSVDQKVRVMRTRGGPPGCAPYSVADLSLCETLFWHLLLCFLFRALYGICAAFEHAVCSLPASGRHNVVLHTWCSESC
jgi:hypothetical protein